MKGEYGKDGNNRVEGSSNICLESECGANLWPLYFYLSNIANSRSASAAPAVASVASTIRPLRDARSLPLGLLTQNKPVCLRFLEQWACLLIRRNVSPAEIVWRSARWAQSTLIRIQNERQSTRTSASNATPASAE